MHTYLDETLAYAAGIIDGEGCISISKVPPQPSRNQLSTSYSLVVSVSNTNHSIIQWLQRVFMGSITDNTNDPSRQHLGWKPVMTWNCGANGARYFLSFILPYLKSKHIQAKVAIDFQDYKVAHPLHLQTPDYKRGVIEQLELYQQHLHSLHSSRTEKIWLRDPHLDQSVQAQAIFNAIPSPLTSSVIAYAAGILDGEGCIRISIRCPNDKVGKGYLRQPSYCLRVKVANTDKSLIEWFHGTFAGYVQECSSEESRARTGYSQAWEWGAGSRKAYDFLTMIIPFLRIKKEQACLALAFQEYYEQHSRYVQGTRPQEVIDRQESYRQQINGMSAKRAPKLDEELDPIDTAG